MFFATPGRAQVGNSGSIAGIVKDQSGSAIGNASVEVMNPVSGFHRETTTDSDGAFRFTNVPFKGQLSRAIRWSIPLVDSFRWAAN
jgi:hypothetical protein